MISKEREAEVLRLYHAEKWPVGTIAAQLGVHHSTVSRVLAQAGLLLPRGSSRPSIADPYMPFILEVLTKYPRLPASRLYQMVRERGYHGARDHFRHIVARVRPRPPAEAFLRLRTLPGEQGQVDWAHFGKLTIGRAERTLWAFVMVLSWSRAIFLRFYLSAAMPSFLRGHVDAFHFFSGSHDATEERERTDETADEVVDLLRTCRLGVCVVRGAEHSDEQLDFDHLAGRAIHEMRLLSRVIDEQLVASEMVLAHHESTPLLVRAIAVAERRVLVAARMLLEVFEMKQLERAVSSEKAALVEPAACVLDAFELLRPSGHGAVALFAGLQCASESANVDLLHYRMAKAIGTTGCSTRTMRTVLRWLEEGRLSVRGYCDDRRYTLDDDPSEFFQADTTGLKLMLYPWE